MSGGLTDKKTSTSPNNESKFLRRSFSFRDKKKWRLNRSKSVHEGHSSGNQFSWIRKDMYSCDDNSLNDDGKTSLFFAVFVITIVASIESFSCNFL